MDRSVRGDGGGDDFGFRSEGLKVPSYSRNHEQSLMLLNALDQHLLALTNKPKLAGFPRFVVEFLYFGVKQARACSPSESRPL